MITSTNLVSFDGVTNWDIDTTFSAVQIDSADMKLIKLVDDPGSPETQLFDGEEITADITLIGWGVGRDERVADSGVGPINIWDLGNNLDKPWGTNKIGGVSNATIAGYTYDFIRTDLNLDGGSNEAAITLYTRDPAFSLTITEHGNWPVSQPQSPL